MSDSLDQDEAQHFVGPDLSPPCLQKLSAEDTSLKRVKIFFFIPSINIAMETYVRHCVANYLLEGWYSFLKQKLYLW